MGISDRTSRLGLVLATGGATAATAWATWRLLALVGPALSDPAGPSGPLLAVAAGLAAAVCGRLCLTALACTVYGCSTLGRSRRAPGGGTACRAASRACARVAVLASPGLLRPLVAVLVAGGIAVGAAATATAAGPAGSSRPALPDPGWSPALASPTWTPTRPAAPARPQPDVSVVAATALRGDGTPPVVVRRGDTLWTIAARQLGPDATDAEIAEQWPRWWRANRTRIGDDPDLLLPGQVLLAPTTEASR
jgi:hypothetical protein